jgi:predicted nicotinamide N-methyase
MELGCGHGLPGIFVMKQGTVAYKSLAYFKTKHNIVGALHVNFMDYNKEVLELTTCPNVLKNVGSELYQRASFYAGAWESVSTYMGTIECLSNEEMQYDLILSAETIYTECITVELYEVYFFLLTNMILFTKSFICC